MKIPQKKTGITTEAQARKHYDLHGFLEIEKFIKSPSTAGSVNFIKWRNLWSFPIHSIENQWFASKKEIASWATDRGFKSHFYKDLNFGKLEKERLQKARETGEIRKFGFMIYDFGLISQFCGKSDAVVMDWVRNSTNPPPIHSDGLSWTADADKLQIWLEQQGFQPFRAPGLGINTNKFMKAERRLQEAGK